MAKTKSSSAKAGSLKVGRDAKTGKFVNLKDGRKIVVPPAGGALSKVQIREAVRKVRASRLEAAG